MLKLKLFYFDVIWFWKSIWILGFNHLWKIYIITIVFSLFLQCWANYPRLTWTIIMKKFIDISYPFLVNFLAITFYEFPKTFSCHEKKNCSNCKVLFWKKKQNFETSWVFLWFLMDSDLGFSEEFHDKCWGFCCKNLWRHFNLILFEIF